MIRVVIADDHHLVRQGIRALLEKPGDIEVVAEAADGPEALELVQRLLPDVLVLDIAMPHLNGVEAVGRLRGLGVKTQALVLSMYADDTLVRQALRNGAKGYLLKRAVSDELLLAVRAVSRGDTFLSPEVAGPVVSSLVDAPRRPADLGPLDQLTSREREVLQLIAEGHTNSTIARHLRLSEKTVEKHRANLMAKLKIHDTAALVRLAIKHGLVSLDT
ncbi:MAG TPA: response regulator transcription factor [Syntrophobacteria bacterium]|nr:response regulator transcription factor [Syntrophobacteria bacterium]